ncbi:TspO/MBR family protein [Oceanobacillus damuensis]|uniref:TspO/MBR family protein n=1 Tax=Oceanobacillus damuensis TaxID=937928 RepID=UPI0008373B8B|nr:TspO/MBR family protein [Oceanobacillus damuensis]
MKDMKQIHMYIAFVLMIAVNAMANMFTLKGYTTGEISNMYTVYFTPASYTFSIWTLIYIALFLWLLSFSLKMQKLGNSQYWGFLLTCLFNVLWIISWHFLLDGVALIIILMHFLTILYLYHAQRSQNKSIKFLAPISLYVGWITVASLINILYWLVASIEINTDVQMILTYLAVAIVLILGFAVMFLLRDWVIILVFIWAIIGIFVMNFPDQWLLAIVTISIAIFLAVLSVLYWIRTRHTS